MAERTDGMVRPLEGELLELAVSGDRDAFDRLLGPRLDRLYRMAVAITRSETDARDATQDACVLAWRELPRLRDRSKFDAWLSQIVVNAARGVVRRTGRARVREMSIDAEPAAGGSHVEPSVAAETDTFADADAIQRAFGRLDGATRALARPPLRRRNAAGGDRAHDRVPGRNGQMATVERPTGPGAGAGGRAAMSEMMRLTDDAIRAALTPAAEVRAPAGLAAGIRAVIDTTPQRRARRIGWAPSRRTRLVLQFAVVGLLLLAMLGAILLVGSHRSDPTSLPTVTTYRGGPARTAVMPGPGPIVPLRVEWQAGVKGPIAGGSPGHRRRGRLCRG